MKKDRRKRKPAAETERYGGIRLQTLNSIMIMIVIGVSMTLLVGLDVMSETYRDLKATSDSYDECQDYARDLQAVSEDLTNEARAFAVTGNRLYLDDYFTEKQRLGSSNGIIDRLKENIPDEDAIRYIEEVTEELDRLTEREYYSMHLMATARDYNETSLPQAIQETPLKAEDLKLSDEKKREKAVSMLFDDFYRFENDRVSENVDRCVAQIIRSLDRAQEKNFRRMGSIVHYISLLIGFLMFVFLILIVLIIRLVIRPLERNVDYLNERSHLPLKGAFELQYMASVYNHMFDEIQEKSDRLAYDAIHDGLTGAYNRAGFEEKLQSVDQDSIALILIDIDYFKKINDTHGHTIGDLMLQQVVRLIQENFRQEDYVCRIGGDEFAVIMVFADSSMRGVIQEKFDRINRSLNSPTGTLPPASLSAGVAFCDRPEPTDNMFRDADSALYAVKREGRNGIRFYEGPEEDEEDCEDGPEEGREESGVVSPEGIVEDREESPVEPGDDEGAEEA